MLLLLFLLSLLLLMVVLQNQNIKYIYCGVVRLVTWMRETPTTKHCHTTLITACQAESGRDSKSTLNWDKLSDTAVRQYERLTERGFNNLNIPDGMKCSDPNCQNPNHINDIDTFYDDIFTVLAECSESLANDNSTR